MIAWESMPEDAGAIYAAVARTADLLGLRSAALTALLDLGPPTPETFWTVAHRRPRLTHAKTPAIKDLANARRYMEGQIVGEMYLHGAPGLTLALGFGASGSEPPAMLAAAAKDAQATPEALLVEAAAWASGVVERRVAYALAALAYIAVLLAVSRRFDDAVAGGGAEVCQECFLPFLERAHLDERQLHAARAAQAMGRLAEIVCGCGAGAVVTAFSDDVAVLLAARERPEWFTAACEARVLADWHRTIPALAAPLVAA